MKKIGIHQLLLMVGVVLSVILSSINIYLSLASNLLILVAILGVFFNDSYRKKYFGNLSKYVVLLIAVIYVIFIIRYVYFYYEWQKYII
jgi:hypothetical protein